MALMMGVEMVLKSKSTKAKKKMMARGVAGRNMAGGGGRIQTSVGVLESGFARGSGRQPGRMVELSSVVVKASACADEQAIRLISTGDGAYGLD
jgi:hypothetical protein